MMSPILRVSVLSIALLVSACGLLNIEFRLPNLDRPLPPTSGNFNGSATNASMNSPKRGIINLVIDYNLSSTLQIDPYKSCVQLVELSGGQIVIDFYAATCPATPSTPSANSLKFVLTYEEQNSYAHVYTLVHEGVPVGSMQVDFDTPAVFLRSLCTGPYQYDCFISTYNGTFDDIIVY